MKWFVLLALTGCAAAAKGQPAPATPSEPAGAQESEIVRDLAAIDRRIAKRANIAPANSELDRIAMGAAIEGDASVVVIDGAIDPFSFAARAKALALVKAKVEHVAVGGNERVLLQRLVDGEASRLDEEKELPRSASALVRAIVDTWKAPGSPKEIAEDDRWLSKRLALVRESIEKSDLDVVRARELDDALDGLEHIATGFTATTQELVHLREVLDHANGPAPARPDWPTIAKRLALHTGVTSPPEALAKDLAALEADLRTKAEAALVSVRIARDALASGLDARVFVWKRCSDEVSWSQVRSMAASPERTPSCNLRHVVASAETAEDQALALAAMHDHVVLAAWALDVARGNATLSQTEGHLHLLVPVTPDVRARYERIALARPVAAIGAAMTVKLLLNGDPHERAQLWSTLGDVPLDVADNEL